MSTPAPSRVLVVEDDPIQRRRTLMTLERSGIVAGAAADGAAAVAALLEDRPSAVLLDLGLPDISGQDLLRRIPQLRPGLPVIVLTSESEIDQVVRCMRLGAFDYLPKPIDPTRLVTTVRNACAQDRLQGQVAALSGSLRRERGFGALLGASAAIRDSLDLLQRGAESDISILLQGESGTGKEIAARALHAESARATGPFVAVNCGAIPAALIESELFGHARGAFTGADSPRAGLFERANGGTLFLDEVAELPLAQQVRLLRVLQERVVVRVGDHRERPLDLRIVAATHHDLRRAVERGDFREDLYYRLAVFPIELPPLRARAGDIVLLAERFARRFAALHDRPASRIGREARQALIAHRWPGNVRELENAIERAVILEDAHELGLASLPREITAPAACPAPLRLDPDVLPLEQVERDAILTALASTDWNLRSAARELGIARATLYRKLERHGLQRPKSA